MGNHHFSWENPLFLWPFSIAFCWHNQRVIRMTTLWDPSHWLRNLMHGRRGLPHGMLSDLPARATMCLRRLSRRWLKKCSFIPLIVSTFFEGSTWHANKNHQPQLYLIGGFKIMFFFSHLFSHKKKGGPSPLPSRSHLMFAAWASDLATWPCLTRPQSPAAANVNGTCLWDVSDFVTNYMIYMWTHMLYFSELYIYISRCRRETPQEWQEPAKIFRMSHDEP